MPGGIKHWPEDERPREKLLKRGAEALTDAELLALILRTGDAAAKRSAIDLGRELLREFDGDLRKLAGAAVAEICRVKGTGPAKAASIKAALELAKRFEDDPMRNRDRFTCSEQIFNHYHHAFRDRGKEHLYGASPRRQEPGDPRGADFRRLPQLEHRPPPRNPQPGGP